MSRRIEGVFTGPRGEIDPTANPVDGFLVAMLVAAPEVYPGVLADCADNGVWFSVRSVIRDPNNETPGAVGEWMDTWPRDRRCIVYAVVSDRLAGMLVRRGFVPEKVWDTFLGMWDRGAFVRNPEVPPMISD